MTSSGLRLGRGHPEGTVLALWGVRQSLIGGQFGPRNVVPEYVQQLDHVRRGFDPFGVDRREQIDVIEDRREFTGHFRGFLFRETEPGQTSHVRHLFPVDHRRDTR